MPILGKVVLYLHVITVHCPCIPVHVCYEASKEHLAIMLSIKVRSLLWGQSKSSLL